jgi:exopolyphosphatase/guanosine-5'-triphosphate,3'-diphosphate pyrophosphatase
MTKNYAGIDLGSNSCKILICDENKKTLYTNNISTRLAEGMHENNMITDDAIERCQKCFYEYKRMLDKYNVSSENMRAIATAACRMAKNGSEVVKKLFDESHIKMDIIDGKEEAELTLKGAMEHVLGKSEYVIVYDLGGASTEVTLAKNSKNPKIISTVSIPWGARNSSEAFDLVEYNEERADKLRDEVDKSLDEFFEKAGDLKDKDVAFVATSSTPLRLVSMIKQFGDYNRERADGLVMNKDDMDKTISYIFGAKRTELAKNPYIGDKRSYIFISAAVIFKQIYDRLGVREVTASLKNAKDGIVADLIEKDKKSCILNMRNKDGKTY